MWPLKGTRRSPLGAAPPEAQPIAGESGMAATPPFIKTSRYASLWEIEPYWYEGTGIAEVVLRRRGVRRLWYCCRSDGPNWNGHGCCRRMVRSFEYGLRSACSYRKSWVDFEPLSEAWDASSRDLLLDAADVEWLAAALPAPVPPPPWLPEWREHFPPLDSPAPLDSPTRPTWKQAAERYYAENGFPPRGDLPEACADIRKAAGGRGGFRAVSDFLRELDKAKRARLRPK